MQRPPRRRLRGLLSEPREGFFDIDRERESLGVYRVCTPSGDLQPSAILSRAPVFFYRVFVVLAAVMGKRVEIEG